MNANPALVSANDKKERAWLPWVVLAFLWGNLIIKLQFQWENNEDYAFGYAVPFLTLYLFWQRWNALPPQEKSSPVFIKKLAIWGIAILATVLLPIRLFWEVMPNWRTVIFADAMTVIGITWGLVLYRCGLRRAFHLAFSIAFILTAVPMLSVVETPLRNFLTHCVTREAVVTLNFLGYFTVNHGNVLQIGDRLVGVSDACGGIRSLQITLMISLFLGELYRLSIFKRLLLLSSTTLFAQFCNLMRAIGLSLIVFHSGNEAANRWHDKVGLIALSISLGCLWGAAALLKPKLHHSSNVASPEKTITEKNASMLVWPRKFVIGLALWIIAVEITNEAWFRYHEITSKLPPMWTIQFPKDKINFHTIPVPKHVKEGSGCDSIDFFAWNDSCGYAWAVYSLGFDAKPTSGFLAHTHNPGFCLTNIGMRQTSQRKTKVFQINGISIPVDYYLFDNNGQTFHVWWCIWDQRVTANERQLLFRSNIDPQASAIENLIKGRRNLAHQVLEVSLLGTKDEKNADDAFYKVFLELVKK